MNFFFYAGFESAGSSLDKVAGSYFCPDSLCKVCTGADFSKCTTCIDGTTLVNDTCYFINSNSTVIGLRDQPCDSSCSGCSYTAYDCTTCASSYYRIGPLCYKCPIGKYTSGIVFIIK